jgi:membrane protein DedA with SNARE-associated domain
MHMGRFIAYTFIGSLIWCWVLAYVGMKMGENWTGLKEYFHQFHIVITVAAVVFVVWYVRRHLRLLKHHH